MIKMVVEVWKKPSLSMEAFTPDGLTEVWWDSVEAMNHAMGSPEGQAASAELAVDEQMFCDSTKTSAFLAVEETIFDFTDPKAG